MSTSASIYVPASNSLDELEQRVRAHKPDPRFPHDPYVLITLEEAIAAARDGNFGVGACLVNPQGQVVERGHNHVFHPYPRTDLHAEMDTLTRFEERVRAVLSLRDYTLFTSLEPCPMCLTRLITAGVGHVFHAAPDVESGMVYKLHDLTPVWVELAKRQEFAAARTAPELQDIGQQVFLFTANRNTARLQER
jgi:tRNA(adenine34) deaminase